MSIPNVMIWSHPRAMSTAFLRSFEGPKVYSKSLIKSEPILEIRLRGFFEPDDSLEKSFGELFDKFIAKGPFVWKEHPYHLQINNWVKYEEEKERFKKVKHIFIIRHPERSMSSMMRMLRKTNMSRENPDMVPLFKDWGLIDLSQKDLCKTFSGYENQVILFEKLIEMGEKPLVIDADDLTSDPQPFLDELCKRAEFPWTGEKMMSWEGDMKGVHPLLTPWFDVANGSTGFVKKNLGTWKDHLAECSPEDREDVGIAISEVLPFYEKLKKRAITIDE